MNIKETRDAIVAQRLALSSEDVKEKSLAMTKDIIADRHYQESEVIYLYFPFKNEIDTNYLITKALQDNKTIAVPVILSSGDMVFCKISNADSQSFRMNRFNILEPSYNPINVIDRPGLMIVPIAAFEGPRRIGNGKQYYNNYLMTRKNYLYTIGVAYDFQKVTGIDDDARDVLLNEIRAY